MAVKNPSSIKCYHRPNVSFLSIMKIMLICLLGPLLAGCVPASEGSSELLSLSRGVFNVKSWELLCIGVISGDLLWYLLGYSIKIITFIL